MNILELKKYIDSLIDNGIEDAALLITLKEPSVGPRASVSIKYIHQGFDWEHNQIRIEPEEDLTRYKKDRDNPLPIKIREEKMPNGKNIKIRKCPKCGDKVTRSQNYCSMCGQRINSNAN